MVREVFYCTLTLQVHIKQTVHLRIYKSLQVHVLYVCYTHTCVPHCCIHSECVGTVPFLNITSVKCTDVLPFMGTYCMRVMPANVVTTQHISTNIASIEPKCDVIVTVIAKRFGVRQLIMYCWLS